ncbi:hypothetical protein BG004_003015 [Podila humilis]|nr:hypothetical protein BG004_003015 [Podila humilis]
MTPLQLVSLSNIKLNNDIYSTRSLSIHRRVLVKNFVALLYDTNPLLDYWFDDDEYFQQENESESAAGGEDSELSLEKSRISRSGQCGSDPRRRGGCFDNLAPEPLLGEDEQNGWIEQTLNAAGLNDDVDDKDDDGNFFDGNDWAPSSKGSSFNKKTPFSTKDPFARSSDISPSSPTSSSPPPPPSPPPKKTLALSAGPKEKTSAVQSTATLSPPISTPVTHSFMSFPTPIPRAPRSLSSSPNTPSRLSLSMSRPKSAELPQFLNSYLSAVFDVDWSVELPNTEDPLFIQQAASPSPSSSTLVSHSTTSPAAPSSYLSPKRMSDSSASITSFSSSRSSMASLASTMTSFDGGSQASYEHLPLPKGKLWDENGAIPIPILSNTTCVSTLYTTTSGSNSGNNNKNNSAGTAKKTTKSILVKKDPQGHGKTSSSSQGNVGLTNIAINKGLRSKGEGGVKKSSPQRSPPLAPVPVLKKQNQQASKAKATLVPGRRSSLMQTGQIPAVSSLATKTPIFAGISCADTAETNDLAAVTAVTSGVKALSFPVVPALGQFSEAGNVDKGTIVGNTAASRMSQQSSPPHPNSSLSPDRGGYQLRKALSAENVAASCVGLPRPLGKSSSSATATTIQATVPLSTPSTSGTAATVTVAISSYSSASSPSTTFQTLNRPSSPPSPISSSQTEAIFGGRTAKATTWTSDDVGKQQDKGPSSSGFTIQSAPIATIPLIPLGCASPPPYSEPAGFPPSRSRSPPQAPKHLAIVSPHPTTRSVITPSQSQYPPRSPSRSSPATLTNPATALPQLFPVLSSNQGTNGDKVVSPISLDSYRQDPAQQHLHLNRQQQKASLVYTQAPRIRATTRILVIAAIISQQPTRNKLLDQDV